MENHKYIATDGDFDLGASWSTGKPPTVGKSTLTFTAKANDGDTVTIDTRTYTYKDPFVNSANNVYTGASAADSRDNLKDAVNNEAGEGTTYGAGTDVHATILGEDGSTSSKFDAIGRLGGIADTVDATRNMTESTGGARMSWDNNPLTRVARWASDDTARFTEDNDFPPTKNLNQELVDIALILTGENFTSSIGTLDNPLVIAADKVVHLGKGTMHIDNDIAGTIDELIIAWTGPEGALAARIKGGTITRIGVARGRTEIIDTDGTDLLALSFMDRVGSDAIVSVAKTTSAITDLMQAGGELAVMNDATITTMTLSDGFLRNTSSSAVTALRLFNGLVEWNTAGVLTTADLLGGFLDHRKSAHLKTITTLRKWPDARFDFFADLTTIGNDPGQDFDGIVSVKG